MIAIDTLNFSFKVLEEDHTEIDKGPESGVYVYGLYLDGAKWDEASRTLTEQSYGVLYENMPPIWFEPVENYSQDPEEYACPIYKTSVRAGVLSTTGQSTDFIIDAQLPTRQPPTHWIKRGSALL